MPHIHRREYDVEHRYTMQAGERVKVMFWQARCDCGWEGACHYGANAAEKAKAEYGEHAEDALGAEAYYTAPAGCLNCSYEGDVQVLLGTDVWGAVCPHCSTSGRLRPSGIFERDRDEPPMRWRF